MLPLLGILGLLLVIWSLTAGIPLWMLKREEKIKQGDDHDRPK